MWNKIVVVVSAVNDDCSFEFGNNPGLPGYRKRDSIFKLPCSAFLWLRLLYLNEVVLPLIKSG